MNSSSTTPHSTTSPSPKPIVGASLRAFARQRDDISKRVCLLNTSII